MAEECFSWLIERPHGISGYRPASWCAVCGRSGSRQALQRCYKEGCPNICHVGCLGEAAEFRCGDTGHLRASLGIEDPIFPYIGNQQPASAATALPTAPPGALRAEDSEDKEDDLKDLQKGELVTIVRTLRSELTITKNSLSNYRFITEDLVDKRRVLVEALSVIDTLIATRDSEEIQYKSVACSAKPHKIDGESTGGETCPQNTPPSNSSLSIPISSPPPSSLSLISPSPYSPASAPPGPPLPALPSPTTSFPSSLPLLSSPTPPPPDIPPPPTPHLSPPTSPISDPPEPTLMGDQNGTPPHAGLSASAPADGTVPVSCHRNKKKNKPPSRRFSAYEEPAFESWEQQRHETAYLRQEQPRCPRCRRRGHTRDQCSTLACDYCQGRFHSSQTCRIRMADLRQHELIKAVRESGQETLQALRSFTWQMHPTSQLMSTGAPLVARHYGPQFPHPPWPASASNYAHYGTLPPLQPPLPNTGRQ